MSSKTTDIIVKPGCSFFIDFVRYDEGATLSVTASQLKRIKHLVEPHIEDEADEDDVKSADASPEKDKGEKAEAVTVASRRRKIADA